MPAPTRRPSPRSAAAALSIPLLDRDGGPLAGRPLVLVLTTSVVVLTLVVQGLTLAAVVHRSGLALEPEHTAREEDEARDELNRAALEHVEGLAEPEAVPDTGAAARPRPGAGRPRTELTPRARGFHHGVPGVRSSRHTVACTRPHHRTGRP